MLTTRIIPCLDVHGGRVVRGVQFSADKDAGDPIELALRYNEQSADELVYYDITASAEERGIFQDLVERTADQLFIPLTVGGGIRTVPDMRRMLMAGADKVSINTAAVENPDLINAGAEGFGSQCTVLSMDVKRVPQADGTIKWHVFTHGGRRQTRARRCRGRSRAWHAARARSWSTASTPTARWLATIWNSSPLCAPP